MEGILATMREIACRATPEESEELWRTYAAAAEALARYGELLYRLAAREQQVPAPTAYRYAVAAAAAVYEYLLATAAEAARGGKSEVEAIAEVLARIDKRLLAVLAARIVIQERYWGKEG